jgi:hypothetical protein
MCDIRSTAVLHFDRGEEGSAEQLAAEKLEYQFKKQILRRKVKRFRGGLVSKPHRLVYHSTQGWIVIKKKKNHWQDLIV